MNSVFSGVITPIPYLMVTAVFGNENGFFRSGVLDEEQKNAGGSCSKYFCVNSLEGRTLKERKVVWFLHHVYTKPLLAEVEQKDPKRLSLLLYILKKLEEISAKMGLVSEDSPSLKEGRSRCKSSQPESPFSQKEEKSSAFMKQVLSISSEKSPSVGAFLTSLSKHLVEERVFSSEEVHAFLHRLQNSIVESSEENTPDILVRKCLDELRAKGKLAEKDLDLVPQSQENESHGAVFQKTLPFPKIIAQASSALCVWKDLSVPLFRQDGQSLVPFLISLPYPMLSPFNREFRPKREGSFMKKNKKEMHQEEDESNFFDNDF